MLPNQSYRTRSILLFTHSWEETWIYAFPKALAWSKMQAASCWIQIQVVNSFSYDDDDDNGYVLSHHHHHIVLAARISLTLSRHSSLSFIALGRSSGQHPVSSHSCWMYVRAGRPAFARPCVGIHKSTLATCVLRVKIANFFGFITEIVLFFFFTNLVLGKGLRGGSFFFFFFFCKWLLIVSLNNSKS